LVLSHLKNLVKNLAEADNVGPIAACTLIKCGDTAISPNSATYVS
jgi:hypothetical protein